MLSELHRNTYTPLDSTSQAVDQNNTLQVGSKYKNKNKSNLSKCCFTYPISKKWQLSNVIFEFKQATNRVILLSAAAVFSCNGWTTGRWWEYLSSSCAYPTPEFPCIEWPLRYVHTFLWYSYNYIVELYKFIYLYFPVVNALIYLNGAEDCLVFYFDSFVCCKVMIEEKDVSAFGNGVPSKRLLTH